MSKTSRHYPCQRTLQLKDTTSAVAGGRFLSASRALSSINRRLYRQSRVYSMKLDVDIGSVAAADGVDVYVLNDTWDLHGAYKLAMKTYYNAIKEELMAKNANTRWYDFRVKSDFQADEVAFATYNPASSTPTMTGNTVPFGDQDFSSFADAAGTMRTFSLDSGSSASEFSISAEWSRQSRIDADPSTVSTAMAYAGVVEDYDEATYDALRENGALPPYDQVTDTDLWRKVGTIRQVSPDGVAKLSTGFFDAPLGIVILISNTFTTSNRTHDIYVTFQKGDYKGVKAPSYATPVLTPDNVYEVI